MHPFFYLKRASLLMHLERVLMQRENTQIVPQRCGDQLLFDLKINLLMVLTCHMNRYTNIHVL